MKSTLLPYSYKETFQLLRSSLKREGFTVLLEDFDRGVFSAFIHRLYVKEIGAEVIPLSRCSTRINIYVWVHKPIVQRIKTKDEIKEQKNIYNHCTGLEEDFYQVILKQVNEKKNSNLRVIKSGNNILC